jgi:serine/threonine-protein kinase
MSVTPDGATTVAVVLRDGAPMQLATVRLDGSGQVERLLGGPARVINGELSPNGQWLAYQSNETAREEIYVSPFPNVTARRIHIGVGIQPAWCRTGQQLFYLDNDGYLTEVTFDVAGFRAGTSRRVLDRRYAGYGLGRSFDVSQDCQRFLMFKDEGNTPTDTPLRMVLLLDWLDELKRQLPFSR